MRADIDITPAFEQAVYDVVAAIPEGRVATYGQVAELAGRSGAAQEVGIIMSRVKIEQNLPCHRVVNKAGNMSPEYAFGGKARQRAMLEAEGVSFTGAGSVDMSCSRWGDHVQMTLF